MKKIMTSAAALAMLGSAAMAGGYAEPVIEAPVVVEDTSSSASGWVVPAIIVALVAVAVAADN